MTSGSCLCGAVKFEFSGEMTPIQYCHAKRCRKSSGAASAVEALAPVDGFTWVSGEDNLTRFEAPLMDSPPAYRKAFCSTCGSPMPERLEGLPFMFINPGVLDDDPGSRPFRHAFTGQKACWHEIADQLPQHQALPDGPNVNTLKE
jgi:hypothetical protein